MSVVYNKELKYCINCRLCKSTAFKEFYGDEKYRLNRSDWRCLHPKNISVDLLTGHTIKGVFHPDDLRENTGSCGIEGKWFEKRVKII